MSGKMHVKMFLDLVNRLSRPAKAARGDLKGVADAARKLKGERGGDQIAKDLLKTQGAAQGAGRGLRGTAEAARKLKGERVGDQMARDLDRARLAAERYRRELKANKAAMRELAKTTALVNMNPALAGTGRKRRAGAQDAASGNEGGASPAFGNTARGAAVAGALSSGRRALAPIAAGVGAYGAVRGTVGSAVSREKALADVRIKLDGMDDAKAFDAMKKQISEAAITYGRSFEEIAKLVAEGGASGVQVGDMAEFIKLATSAAAAWDQPAEQVANALAKIRAQTGATLPQLREFGDMVNSLSDAGAAKEMDVVEMFKRAGAAAKASGVDMKTALAALTAMNNVGMEPEIAARGFAAMAGKLFQATVQGEKFQDGLKMLGLNAKKLEKDMKLNAPKAIVDVLEKLENSADKGKAAIKLMGEEWWDEFLRLAQALPELKKNLKIVSDPKAFNGSMDKSLNVRLDTTATQLERLKTLSAEVGERLGRWTLPHINEGIQKLVNLLNEVDRRSAADMVANETAEKMATGKELSPEERQRMAADPEYRKAVETNAKRRKEEIADQKENTLKGDLKRGVSEDDAEFTQGQRRRQLERLRLDREIEERQKNLAIRDPNGRDATHLGERRRIESLKQKRKELGGNETPSRPMAGRSDREEANSKAPFSASFKQEQEIEALRRKVTVLQELAAAATNARDKMAFLADADPVKKRLDRTIAPNAIDADRFKPGRTGAGENNTAPAIPRGAGKFALGGPATAGGGGVEGASATPEEAAAKWKNVARASAEDLKAAFNIDLGEAGMTMMERLATGITSGGARVDGATEGVGNGVKAKAAAVDLAGPAQQMMAGWAGAITAGGAQVVAATEAVAARVRQAAASGVAGGLKTVSARSALSGRLHDGIA